MKKCSLLLPLLVLLLLSCDSREDFPKANTSSGPTNSALSRTNTFSLAAEDWSFGVISANTSGNPNNYQSQRITTVPQVKLPVSTTELVGLPARTRSYSLTIAASTHHDTTARSCWSCRIPPIASLRPGQTLILKANVQLDNVQGKGVAFTLRGEKANKTTVLYATTEGQASLRGTATFREYTVKLLYESPVDYIQAYLTMLPQTTGKVIFSDVSIQTN